MQKTNTLIDKILDGKGWGRIHLEGEFHGLSRSGLGHRIRGDAAWPSDDFERLCELLGTDTFSPELVKQVLLADGHRITMRKPPTPPAPPPPPVQPPLPNSTGVEMTNCTFSSEGVEYQTQEGTSARRYAEVMGRLRTLDEKLDDHGNVYKMLLKAMHELLLVLKEIKADTEFLRGQDVDEKTSPTVVSS
ncbi:MAG: hypothetical protein GY832_47320 [Chloroflexi bacterium]|nr:hypothetical protein [Chloroflexota bacterium]